MSYIEKTKDKIRKTWFPNHTAELTGEPGLQVLTWHEKGDGAFAVKYILSGKSLVVTGDIGEAIFSLTCQATLENLKEFQLTYFMKQLTAHSVARWDFNTQKAFESLDNWYKDLKDDLKDNVDREVLLNELNEVYLELKGAVGNCSGHEEFESIVFHVADTHSKDWFDDEHVGAVSQFGKELPEEFIAYWIGLQTAIDHLQNGVELDSPEMVCA